MKETFKYIIGILFFLSGLIALFSNPIASILLLIAGLITIPFSLVFIQKKLNKTLSSSMKYIIVIGCLLVSFGLSMLNQTKEIALIANEIKKKEQEKFDKLPQHMKDSIIEIKEVEKAQYEKDKVIKSQFMPRSGEHIKLAKFIKKNMKNPKSYEHVTTHYNEYDDYLIVETTYRGTNSFGGVVPATLKAKVTLNGDVIEILE